MAPLGIGGAGGARADGRPRAAGRLGGLEPAHAAPHWPRRRHRRVVVQRIEQLAHRFKVGVDVWAVTRREQHRVVPRLRVCVRWAERRRGSARAGRARRVRLGHTAHQGRVERDSCARRARGAHARGQVSRHHSGRRVRHAGGPRGTDGAHWRGRREHPSPLAFLRPFVARLPGLERCTSQASRRGSRRPADRASARDDRAPRRAAPRSHALALSRARARAGAGRRRTCTSATSYRWARRRAWRRRSTRRLAA